MRDVVSAVEYRSSRGGWCVVVTCPPGCECSFSNQAVVISGFRTALDAEEWKARTYGEMKHAQQQGLLAEGAG